MAMPLTIKTSSETAVSSDISTERLVNCFLSKRPDAQMSQQVLIGSHGYANFISGSTGASGSEVRGMAVTADGTQGYIVVDDTLYSVDTGGARISRGTLSTLSGKVDMVIGELYIMIIDETYGYTMDFATNTFALISDLQFVDSPTKLTYIDGYFAVIGQILGAAYIALSDLDDPTSWTTLNQAQAEAMPDTLVSIKAFNQELWAFGSTSSEVYVNYAGATGFPLKRVNVHSWGCAAAHSVAINNGIAYWLGKTNNNKATLLRSNGTEIEIVKHEDMNRLFQSFSTVADAYAYTYCDAGQEFYAINFPTANQSWVYCITTDSWFKQEQNNGDRFIASSYIQLGGKHVIGATTSYKTYEMRLTYYNEDSGSAIKRVITTPTYFTDNKWIQPSRVIAYMDSSSFASAQSLQLEASEDGGNTYQTAETDSIVQNDDYAQFTGCSASKRQTFKITFNAAYQFAFILLVAHLRIVGR